MRLGGHWLDRPFLRAGFLVVQRARFMHIREPILCKLERKWLRLLTHFFLFSSWSKASEKQYLTATDETVRYPLWKCQQPQDISSEADGDLYAGDNMRVTLPRRSRPILL